MITLDEWSAEQKLQRLDFVKIDVEGYEREVLRGAMSTLTRFAPVILCEISGVSLPRYGVPPSETFATLASLGYAAFLWRGKYFVACGGPQPAALNYFFIPPQVESEIRAQGMIR